MLIKVKVILFCLFLVSCYNDNYEDKINRDGIKGKCVRAFINDINGKNNYIPSFNNNLVFIITFIKDGVEYKGKVIVDFSFWSSSTTVFKKGGQMVFKVPENENEKMMIYLYYNESKYGYSWSSMYYPTELCNDLPLKETNELFKKNYNKNFHHLGILVLDSKVNVDPKKDIDIF